MALRQRDFDKTYKNQTDAYKAKFSRDEFTGQRDQYERRMAGDAMKEELGVDRLNKEQRAQLDKETPRTSYGGRGNQYYTENKKGDRVLTDISEDSNPYGSLDDFDAANQGRGAGSGRNLLGQAEARRLMKESGASGEDILAKMEADGTKVTKRTQEFLDRKIQNAKDNPPPPEDQPDPDPATESPVTPTPVEDENDGADPDTTAPPETTTPDPVDDEQTDDTLPVEPDPVGNDNSNNSGQIGGVNTGGVNTGDADNGGVSGGTNNTGGNNDNSEGGVSTGAGSNAIGGNNQQEGTGNMVGQGNTNTGGNEQNTEVNFGDSTIGDAGQNNTIDQSQRYYGGNQNNMSIVYGQGSNPGNTSAVSDLTTLGLGKADDSPSTQAQYVDFYQTLNKDAQKDYGNTGSSTAYQYIQNAAATNPIDYERLNTQISESIQNHYDNAALQSNYYMGDGYNYVPPTYNMPEAPNQIENNTEDIAEDAMNNLE